MNEALALLALSYICFGSVYIASTFGKTALKIAACAGIVGVSYFAQVQIDLFGLATNIGNIFYASTFLAMLMIMHTYGRYEAVKAVSWGYFTIAVIAIVNAYVFSSEMTGTIIRNSFASAFAFGIGQLVDSVIFFPAAFWGVLSGGTLIEFMIVGYVFKVLLSVFDFPFFYLATQQE